MIVESQVSSRNTNNHPPALLHRPILFSALPFVFLAFGLPVYSKRLGASAFEIGGLYSVVTATALLLRPVVGWGLDRHGRKLFLVTALGIDAVAMGIFAFSDTVFELYLARFVQGIGSALMWVSVYTIIADLSGPRDRGKAMGHVDEMIARGGIIGALAGFTLVLLLPTGTAWQVIFLAYMAMIALGAWQTWKRVPETRPSTTLNGGNKFTISKQLFKLIPVEFVTVGATAMVTPIYMIFLQDRFTMKISVLAWAFLPAGLVYSFLPSRLGRLGDRFGRIHMMALGLVTAGFLSLLLPNVTSLIWLVLLFTAFAAASAMYEPAKAALVADLTGSDTRGMGYGIFDLAAGSGATAGPLLGGWLYDHTGQMVPFYLVGIMLLASAVWMLIFFRQHPTHVTAPLSANE
jgi:MFS family permease